MKEITYTLLTKYEKTNHKTGEISHILINDVINDINVKINEIQIICKRKDISTLIISLNYNNLDIRGDLDDGTSIELLLKNMFYKLYVYIYFLVGYYPKIIDSSTFNASNLVEIYNTSEKYLFSQMSFINKLDNDSFKYTFEKFINFYDNNGFSIAQYLFTICRINDSFPEIPVVNILQCFDGIYDSLEITKNNRKISNNSEGIKIVKERIRNICLDDLFDDEELDKIKKTINDNISRIENVNFDTKLRFLFDYVTSKYNIFKLEKENNLYDDFIVKCKKTRNKFSHSDEKKNAFNGEEAVFYMYKFSLTFRLLILNEIGLGNHTDLSQLNYLVNLINDRLKETVYKEINI